MQKKKVNISIILPSHNEGENLQNLVKNICKAFEKSEFSNLYEIIIVNDGSTDNTEKIANDTFSKLSNLKLINLKTNVGKAYALDAGIQNSEGNIVATLDADLQYDPNDLISMTKLIYDGNDMVNGERSERKDDFITKLFSKMYNFILRSIFRLQLKDFFSGIKVFRKEIYNLMNYSGLARFILFFSKKYNFKILEIPVNHFERTAGKTSYSFVDKTILSLNDIFTLSMCIFLGKERLYQIRQTILLIYFLIFITLIFRNIFLDDFDYLYLYYSITSLFAFAILNFIIKSFLKSKEKNNFNLQKNIKSIIE